METLIRIFIVASTLLWSRTLVDLYKRRPKNNVFDAIIFILVFFMLIVGWLIVAGVIK
ncbi:MAG: hypothetical protein M0R17_01805 [Candidatus Omnitrophica bacterium]|jgi:hypothetical protein|nr:hypothetical protein [Candidatus Omnitrophota bacterium]